jgi:hypothetical protein
MGFFAKLRVSIVKSNLAKVTWNTKGNKPLMIFPLIFLVSFVGTKVAEGERVRIFDGEQIN